MPKRPQKGTKAMLLELDLALVDRVRSLAESNSRAFREEVSHALSRHLEVPPRIKVIVEAIIPPLPPAEIDPPSPKPKKKTK